MRNSFILLNVGVSLCKKVDKGINYPLLSNSLLSKDRKIKDYIIGVRNRK